MLQQRGPSTQRVLAESLGVSARYITGLVDGRTNRLRHPAALRRHDVIVTGNRSPLEALAAGAVRRLDIFDV